MPTGGPGGMRHAAFDRYASAVLLVGGALLVKLILAPLLDEPAPFLFFLGAVAATGWRGGLGPGLLAAVLAVVASHAFFLAPGALPTADEAMALGLFAVESIAVAVFTARRNRPAPARDPERERTEEALRSAAAEMRAVLDSALDAVVGMSEKGTITFWNPRAEAIFGWSAKEALGRDLAELILAPTDREPYRRGRQRFLRTGEWSLLGQRIETRGLRRDRSHFPLDLSMTARREAGGWAFTSFMADITERKRGEERLRHQLAFTSAITGHLGEGVFALDRDGKITFANPAAERMLGFREPDLLGHPLGELLHARAGEGREADDPLPEVLRFASTVHRDGGAIARSDGSSLAVSHTCSPIVTGGEVVGAVLVFHDATERQQMEERRQRLLDQEQRAREEAENANRMKDEFLAMLSHELRTPLSAIAGWAHILREGGLEPADAARAIEVIDRNAKVQGQLISDILDVSRIISGKLRLEKKAVPASAVVEAAIDTVAPTAEAKHVRLEASLEPEAGVVWADPDRLQQVVWNLLTNAIKFTPEGGLVSIRLARAGSQMEIVVRDTGEGISPDFAPHVFERFRQADSSTTRPHGGLGLGLAIVRHLVEAHGGTVVAESAGKNQGATFTVRLPRQDVAAAAAEPAGIATAELPVRSLEHVRVLLVDDDPDTRGMMETVLSQRGAQVTAASSAVEALACVDREPPDVLLSDIGMPGMDGYALIRELRERPGAREIPAAALTAYAHADDRDQAIAAGYQLHVAKPVEPAELVAVVASLAGRA
jgi:PAS domain S-box-containing protein